jgi:hypothetical protein
MLPKLGLDPTQLLHAPKIQSRDRDLFSCPPAPTPQDLAACMDVTALQAYLADSLLVRQRVIGPLWFRARDQKGSLKRIIVEDMCRAEEKEDSRSFPWVRRNHDDQESRDNDLELGHSSPPTATTDIHNNAPPIRVYPSIVHRSGVSDLPYEHHFDFYFSPDATDYSLYILQSTRLIAAGKTTGRVRRCLKIGRLKVEGEKVKPARIAFAPFADL